MSTQRGIDSKTTLRSSAASYTDTHILSDYTYHSNTAVLNNDVLIVTPQKRRYKFSTCRHIPKHGLMMVGWGGNNGSTTTASVLANQRDLRWDTLRGEQRANYYGSVTQCTTVKVGVDNEGYNIHAPLKSLVPLVEPNDLVIGGWDINNAPLSVAMKRAAVLPIPLQDQVRCLPEMAQVPLPSVFYPDFIAFNQEDRANNVLLGTDKQVHLEHIRTDIITFKKKNQLDSCTVVWTASTERLTELVVGKNDTADHLLQSIKDSDPLVSPSQIFAVAAILEGCTFINGAPQNTLSKGVIELAKIMGVHVAGNDFKSGQTKMKSVLVDFLISAGLKVESIVSYNHLGNNDGKNLSEAKQFRSKELSKSNVVDDMVEANHMLYTPGEKPDHCVVIKYVPYVKDSKRAMDEYISSIFMGGQNTIVMHNTCEDSLLASPLILDLVILSELCTRVRYTTDDCGDLWKPFHPVLSILSYFLKAPVVPEGTPVVNALMKQHRMITNVLLALIGLPADGDMTLETFALPCWSL
jgi:myo-inositol-1-phosphate synthase